MKFSKLAVYGSAAITGVIMLLFQNCGQIHQIDVSDLSAKALGGSSIEQGSDPTVGIEIVDNNGQEYFVDQSGNTSNNPITSSDETVINNNNPGAGSSASLPEQIAPVAETDEEKEFSDIGEDDDSAQVCVARKVSKKEFIKYLLQAMREANNRNKYDHFLNSFHDAVKSTVDHFQQIKCKKKEKKKRCLACEKDYTCQELIAKFADKRGINVIDVSKLASNSVRLSPRGKTILYATADVDDKDLIIDDARGKVIVCGLKIRRLDVIKGKLQLLEGAVVRSIAEHDVGKGEISKDQSCRIDRADEE